MNVMTQKQLQEKYQVSRQCIYLWRKAGLPFRKFGDVLMFEETEVREWYTKYKTKK